MLLRNPNHRHPAADPAVVTDRAAAIPSLTLPAFLAEQHAVWRANAYPQTRTRVSIERMAAIFARERREEAGR